MSSFFILTQEKALNSLVRREVYHVSVRFHFGVGFRGWGGRGLFFEQRITSLSISFEGRLMILKVEGCSGQRSAGKSVSMSQSAKISYREAICTQHDTVW